MQTTIIMSALPNISDKKLSSTEERALALLGQGISPEQVAAAIGVSASFISQLLSNDAFKSLVADAKYQGLIRHNERDSRLDGLEDKLITKLDSSVDLMYKPMEIVRSLQVVNAAKRRGISSTENISGKQEVTQLIMPSVIVNKFSVNVVNVKLNAANQVVQAGEDSLVTIQSGNMDSLLASRIPTRKDHIIEMNAPDNASHDGGQNVPILPEYAERTSTSS